MVGGWREECETEHYRRSLGDSDDDWLRVRFARERNIVTRFTVQYEAIIGAETFAVVRWDTAHGFVHRDTLDRDGRVIDKLPVYGRTYNQAMTEAIADIKTH